jgi:hypothetical protein
MSASIANRSLCSQRSSAVNEQLFGTAPRTEVWILVEYNQPPGENAFEDSDLPPEVKSYLFQQQKAIPNSRVLLLRKDQHKDQPYTNFFIGVSSESNPVIYEFRLNRFEELIDIDLLELIQRGSRSSKYIRQDPLFLVCTNGKRDPCCALWGPQVYSEISHFLSEAVWQTSHVGGHRFAANVIGLPHGIYFGRVRPDQGETLVKSYENGLLSLDHYRGRSCYSSPAQVAEYFLRRESAILGLDTLRILHEEKTSDGQWMFQFSAEPDQSHYQINLTAIESQFEIFESCSNPSKFTKRIQYDLNYWSKL